MCQRSTYVTAVAALLLGLSSAVCAVRAGSTNDAPLPDERLGIRTAPILLLSRFDVRADLKLSAEQVAKAETAITDFWVDANAVKGMRGAAALEARKQVDRRLQLWFEANLTQPQRTRLLQIDLQWEGPSALLRPVVADSLALSPAQRESIAVCVNASHDERARNALTPAREVALNKAALKVLKPAQLTRWRAMIGEPFTPIVTSSKIQDRAKR